MSKKWNEKKDEKEEEYKFKNDKVELFEESKRDSEKAILNCDVNLKKLNRMLLSSNRQGTAKIAQSLSYWEEQKKRLIEGIGIINEMILEIYEDNRKGKEN